MRLQASSYSFNHMELTNADMESIADSMAPHWAALEISNNPKADRGIRAIAAAIQAHPGMTDFSLTHVACRTPIIMDVVHAAHGLWHLDISDCAVEPAAVGRIMDVIMGCPNLVTFRAEGNVGCSELFRQYAMPNDAAAYHSHVWV